MSTRKKPKKADLPKSLKVDRQRFEGIVDRLIHSKHVERENIKVAKKKPEQLIPPQQ